MKWFLYTLLLSALTFTTSGCDTSKVKEAAEPSDEPKTSYGQAVHSGKELSSDSDERNEEIRKQANSLFDEQ